MRRCYPIPPECKTISIHYRCGSDLNTISATVSGDRQVRVFDVGEGIGRSPTGSEMTYPVHQACIRVLRCHSGRTKRIITEDSPDLFLTVAEVRRVVIPVMLGANESVYGDRTVLSVNMT